MTEKQIGGNTNYYLAEIEYPKRSTAYTAECEDIITALKMTFAEGCAFKAIWRSASARLGNGKPGADTFGIYDGEKIKHYGERILLERMFEKRKNTPVVAPVAIVSAPVQPPGCVAYNTPAMGIRVASDAPPSTFDKPEI